MCEVSCLMCECIVEDSLLSRRSPIIFVFYPKCQHVSLISYYPLSVLPLYSSCGLKLNLFIKLAAINYTAQRGRAPFFTIKILPEFPTLFIFKPICVRNSAEHGFSPEEWTLKSIKRFFLCHLNMYIYY